MMIVCSSKCLWCGRETPHEVCHAHSSALGFDPGDMLDVDIDNLWCVGFYQEPETCNEGACPVWEPGEWDRRQAEAALTPEQRAERLAQTRAGIEERRRLAATTAPAADTDAAAAETVGEGEQG